MARRVASTWLLPVALAVAAVVLPGSGVARGELNGDPCTIGWTGPSANNDLACADANRVVNWAVNQQGDIFLPLAIGLITLLVCPLVFFFRYCCQCCGGSHMRPGGCCCCSNSAWDYRPVGERMATYSECERRGTKCAALAVLIVVLCAWTLVYTAGIDVDLGTRTLLTDWIATYDWLRSIEANATTLCQRVDGSSPLPADLFDSFNTALSQVSGVASGTGYVRNHKGTITAGLSGLVVLPVIAALLGSVAALCNTRTCLPAMVALMCFFFCFITGTASTALLAVHVGADVACAEMSAQAAGQPGLLQWKYVPMCQDHHALSDVRDKMRAVEASVGQQACASLESFCDGNAAYVVGGPSFYCDMNAGNCTSYDGVAAIVASAHAKTGATGTCASGTPEECTVAACAESCTSSSLAESSAAIVAGVADADNVYTAYTQFVEPWTSCNALANHIVGMMQPFCSSLPSGAHKTGAGFAVISVTMVVAIVVMFLGQKRFFRPVHDAAPLGSAGVPLVNYESPATYGAYGGQGGYGTPIASTGANQPMVETVNSDALYPTKPQPEPVV